jgi:hypothetical protein
MDQMPRSRTQRWWKQSAAAAQSLNEQASRLTQVVAAFQVDGFSPQLNCR